MARTLPLLLCLTTAFALAGCAGGADPADPSGPASEASAVAAAAPAADAPPVDQPPRSPEVATAVCSGVVAAGAGVQGNFQMGLYCPFREAQRGDLSGHAAALVEVRWAQPMPTQTSFNLFLLSESCNFASESGSCNLAFEPFAEPAFRYEVPAQLLRQHGGDGLRAYASFDGPAVEQAVDIAITLVPVGASLPAGHTALP